ncbi:MAG: cytochrome c oxidase subunit 3 [Arcticibacter sp.]
MENNVVKGQDLSYKLTQIPTFKILLWLSMVSMVMMFAGLTSGYIVRQAEANWLFFEMPSVFTYSTIIIILSSISMFWAQRSVAKNDRSGLTKGLTITLVLGLAFCVTQFSAWSELVRQGIYFTGNPSGSFLYVLSALHLLHLAGGILYLVIVTARSYQGRYTAENHLPIELCSIFWHFLDILWVYLFVFLSLLR